MGSSAQSDSHYVDVHFPDGSMSPVAIFSGSAESEKSSESSPPLVLIWPGWGVGARYYTPLARELASRGYSVAIGELPGQGLSTTVATRKCQFGYHSVASENYPLTIREVKKELSLPEDYPTVMICHSMGGQVGSFFLARPEAQELNIRGLMGVGAGSPDYSSFSGKPRRRLIYGAPMMRLVSQICGFLPGGKWDIAGFGRQSALHIKDWYRFSRGDLMQDLSGTSFDYKKAKGECQIPMLLTRFSNDDDCPLGSCERLAASMNSSYVRVEELPETLGHNRWAREPEAVANRLELFVKDLGIS